MSNSVAPEIEKFLSMGFTQSQVATKLNVSAGLVSQVANESKIKSKVREAQLKYLDEATERDQKYNHLEDVLLDRLKEALPSIYKPQDLVRTLAAINRAERRGASSQQMAEMLNQQESSVVKIQLPEFAKVKWVKSHTQEIVEVNGRAMVTKDSRQLLKEISSASNPKSLDITDIELDEAPNDLRSIETHTEDSDQSQNKADPILLESSKSDPIDERLGLDAFGL